MALSLTFPDSTYSSGNKPSADTLKSDLQSVETAVNSIETLVTTAGTDIDSIEVGLTTGWYPVTGSWSYLSASSVTVPSGAASRFQVGDKVKFTQTTPKYFVVSAVTDTTLTFFVNTDYTVANAAISSIYHSHQENPLGYPHWFNCAVTVDWNGTDPTTPTTIAKYSVRGRTLEFYFKQTNTGAGSSNTQVSVDGFPGSALSGATYNKSCEVTASTATDGSLPDTGPAQSPRGIIYGTTSPTIYAFFPTMAARSVWLSGSYPV